MALVAMAEKAQDIASALNKFLDPVTESSAEITRLISECFAISSALRELADFHHDPLLQARQREIRDDLQVLLRSLEYTFEDVHRLVGGVWSAGYRQVWRDIETYFQEESRNSLWVRLKYYWKFLDDMICIMVDGYPPDYDVYDEIYSRIEDLLDVQESKLDVGLDNLTLVAPLGATSSSRQRSFERKRPPRRPAPVAPDPPRRRPSRHERPSRYSTPADHHPAVPHSPTTTTTSTSTESNSSSGTSSVVSHWVAKVFEQRPATTTPFRTPGHISECYGKEMTSRHRAKLAEDYDKLYQMPLEDGDLVVRLYVRPSDQRAQIRCHARKQYCASLATLRIERDKSTIKLHTMGSTGRPKDLWAYLRFANYERLVLFFCTFLAMRAEDSDSHARQTDDHELGGEQLLYSGKIVDDHCQHRLHLLRDRDSDGIRLQASAYHGKRHLSKPVWTAFITHRISSPRWMTRASSKTIHLSDLQPFIFCSDYVPPLGPRGEHELRFVDSEDANDFQDVVKELKELKDDF